MNLFVEALLFNLVYLCKRNGKAKNDGGKTFVFSFIAYSHFAVEDEMSENIDSSLPSEA